MVQVPKWFVALVAVVVVVGLAAPVLADETKVTIKTVNADKMTFTATDKDNKEWTFHMANDGKVTVADKDVKLADLKAGEQATVTYDKKGNDLIAKEVKVEKK